MALALSWGLAAAGLISYTFGGGCPETWRGFSSAAFVDLKDFVKLSAAPGVMLWYVPVRRLSLLILSRQG
jgi:MATE family multidrug resistance protein